MLRPSRSVPPCLFYCAPPCEAAPVIVGERIKGTRGARLSGGMQDGLWRSPHMLSELLSATGSKCMLPCTTWHVDAC